MPLSEYAHICVILFKQVLSKIKALGGQVVSVGEYDTCTHICLGNEMNKRLIAENWINLSYNGDDVSIPPETAEGDKMVTSIGSRPRRMTVNLNRDISVRRELFPVSAMGIDEEKIRCLHLQLFQCMSGESGLVTFAAYARKMRRSFIVSDMCPGTNRDDFHTSTLLELKLICKEIYLLLKALKKAGYSLAGNFSANNFVVIERVTGKGILFGHLQKDSLQRTSSTAEISDEKAFKRMVIGLFPKNVLPPHDLVTWLALVGRKDKEWLLLNNWTLLDEQDARERFLFLCGKLQELSESVHTAKDYYRIVGRLNKKGYDKWQEKIEAANGNNYLMNTPKRVNPDTNLHQDYKKHAGGLLVLLRNCRHHYAKAVVQKFLMIVADNFPNLLMDIQEEMYIEEFCA